MIKEMFKEILKYRLNAFGWLLFGIVLLASFDLTNLSGFFIGLVGFPLVMFMGAFYQEGQKLKYTKGYKETFEEDSHEW